MTDRGDDMTKDELLKNLFLFFSELYKEPTEEMFDVISDEFFQRDLTEQLALLNFDIQLEKLYKPMSLLEMKWEYEKLFSGSTKPYVPLYESFYKVWTTDQTAKLPFAHQKGLFMGDAAWHMRFLLEELDIELSEECNVMPDHLAVILEVLTFFIENEKQMEAFILSHLDWLSELINGMKNITNTSFYLTMTELLEEIIKVLVKEEVTIC